MKIITICGSLKFQKEMMEISEKLTLEGNCVLSVVYPVSEERIYTDREKAAFGEAHLERIRLSDAIYIVNVDGYIGSSTRAEIELAERLGKEIIYHQRVK